MSSLPDQLMSCITMESCITEDLLMNDTMKPDNSRHSEWSSGAPSTSSEAENNPSPFPPAMWSSGETRYNNSPNTCRYVASPFAFGMPWETIEDLQVPHSERTSRSALSSTSSSSSSPTSSRFQDLALSSYPPVFSEREEPLDHAACAPLESDGQPPPEYINLMKAYREWNRYKQRKSSNCQKTLKIPRPFHDEEDKGCVLCKKNCKPRSFYSTHVLKDNNGVVICPVLRAFSCPRCGATGDHAHTLRHCPVARMQNHV